MAIENVHYHLPIVGSSYAAYKNNHNIGSGVRYVNPTVH